MAATSSAADAADADASSGADTSTPSPASLITDKAAPDVSPSSTSTAAAPNADGPCALLWLHGLGDTGAGWEHRFAGLEDLPGLRSLFPTAPVRHVRAMAADEAQLAAWFDLHTYPVALEEPEDGE